MASTLIGRLVESARDRRSADPALAAFLREYYAELPGLDADDRRDGDLYAVAATHLAVGRVRPAGTTLVEVRSPDRDLDGWHSERSVVLIVTDDAPFLVDTVRIVLERHHVAMHLLVHPMMRVRRDGVGQLIDVLPRVGDGADVGPAPDGSADSLEAWTQIEIDRCDSRRASALRDDLHAAIASVHRVVADFDAMRDRMRAIADESPLLGWLADGHFVFLGAATFDLGPSGDAGSDGSATCRSGTALGVLAFDEPIDPEIDPDGPRVTVARSEAPSTVHRNSRMTVVTVLCSDEREQPVAQRFVGLLASTAYRQSVLTIPEVGQRARSVLGLASDGAETHTGRSMRNVLETLPRDLVFELDTDALAHLVIEVVGLQGRQIVRVFDVPEPVGHSTTIFVYLPKGRFTGQLPERIAALVGEAYQSPTRELESFLGGSNLARITCTVTRNGHRPDLGALAAEIDRNTTAWIDLVRERADHRWGSQRADSVVARLGGDVPLAYQNEVDPDMAVGDIDRLLGLLDSGDDTRAALVREVDAEPDVWRIRVYRRGETVALSVILPLLDHLGMVALDEHPYEFVIDGQHLFLYDIGIRVPRGVAIDDARHAEITSAFEGLLAGRITPDGFNRLITWAGLTAAQADVLRCYAKYAQQTSFPFSQRYVEDSLTRSPAMARMLVELFEAKFDPLVAFADRGAMVAEIDARLATALDAVTSLDDDRIGRMFVALIRATVRTSAYRDTPTLAFKFDPSMVPDLPQPRPAFEIFVCSPRVEGVHLRGGPIARGGLRWSDRPEDYRTEVLGLVKAQMVKNAVIVPVGSKGGFVVKQPPADPTELRAEGLECYRMFVRGLLDLTDNVVGNVVVHPDDTVRYDGDDPYLVVAADKGTATFSDTANEIAAEYDFWLGDAFASGGSAGYDHKAMGITARGAWESVRRHAMLLGKDADLDELTVVGIGDMSGDVFGNGLLRSRHVRLMAAFDHRHVFVDPTPDPGLSFDERRRLYELPRSSWADYDPTLISPGGGVFARSSKSIELTSEMRIALDVEAEHLTPNELIGAILKAPVDLLWNGGVGTYVKASTESDAEVGDRTNDAVRIDGNELRCRMVAEGGNLGVTQLGRVEYAIAGGLIYTDAIDNSGGVDCSDHEVNIKILLGDVIAQGEMTLAQRNVLLSQMTDEVAELVLANNKAQTLALQIARTQGLPMVNVHARYLDQLETEGWLNRALEFLPTDKQIVERQAAGSGLRTPEFAVMIAYTKNANISEIMQTDLPDVAVLAEDVAAYFPTPLRERYRDEIDRHRLHRHIAATQLMNQMVNLSGISYDHRMTEDTGATITDVARGWLVAREVLEFPLWWEEVAALQGLSLDDQLSLFLDCRRTAERCSLWFLRNRRPPIDIATEVARFKAPTQALAAELGSCLRGPMAAAARAESLVRQASGVPVELADRSSVWRLLHTTFDMIELAERLDRPAVQVATAYFEVFDRLELLWLWDGIGALPRSDRWQTQARSALRDDLLAVLAELARNVMEHGGDVDEWFESNDRSIQRTRSLLTEIRRAGTQGITNLSVALRQLRNLALTSATEI